MAYTEECLISHVSGSHPWALVVLAVIWATRDIVLFVLIPRADRASALGATTENSLSNKDITE